MSKRPKLISIIAAVAENGVIGCKMGMPWKLSTDLRRFKKITTGNTVIMGKRTFEGIGKMLPGRKNIVLSTSLDSPPNGCYLSRSIDDAISMAEDENEIFFIGGAKVFELAVPIVDRLYLTTVHASPCGDTFFPEITYEEWKLLETEKMKKSGLDEFSTTFRVWERK